MADNLKLSAESQDPSASSSNLAPIFAASSKRAREESMTGNSVESITLSTTVNTDSGTIKKTKLEETVSASTPTVDGSASTAVASTSTSVVTKSTSSNTMSFKWLASNTSRLLHGIYGPPHFASKVACFDIDGTLIATASGAKFPKDAKDWVFWCGKGNVQARLKEYYQKGYSIVFVSNQNYPPGHAKHQAFKAKVPLIARSLGDIPFRVLAATAKDEYRKPNIGIWTLLNQTHTAQGFPLDKASSFYVGDAAGRPARRAQAPLGNGKFKTQSFVRDHSDTDKGWAKNVGITFYTPEEFFWDRKDELAAAPDVSKATEAHSP